MREPHRTGAENKGGDHLENLPLRLSRYFLTIWAEHREKGFQNQTLSYSLTKTPWCISINFLLVNDHSQESIRINHKSMSISHAFQVLRQLKRTQFSKICNNLTWNSHHWSKTYRAHSVSDFPAGGLTELQSFIFQRKPHSRGSVPTVPLSPWVSRCFWSPLWVTPQPSPKPHPAFLIT